MTAILRVAQPASKIPIINRRARRVCVCAHAFFVFVCVCVCARVCLSVPAWSWIDKSSHRTVLVGQEVPLDVRGILEILGMARLILVFLYFFPFELINYFHFCKLTQRLSFHPWVVFSFRHLCGQILFSVTKMGLTRSRRFEGWQKRASSEQLSSISNMIFFVRVLYSSLFF